MKSFKRTAILIAVLCCAFAVCIACSGCKDNAKLTVATSLGYKPLIYKDGTQITGLEADLWDAVAKEANLRYEYREMNFDDIEGAINNGQADVAVSAVSVTAQRKQNFIFSYPYYTDNTAIVKMKTNKSIPDEATWDDIDKEGVVLAVEKDTTTADWAKGNFRKATVKEYLKTEDVYNAFMKGEVSVAAANSTAIECAAATYDKELKVILTDDTNEDYAFMFNSADTELQQKVNNALIKLQSNGTLHQIIAKWLPEVKVVETDAIPKYEK